MNISDRVELIRKRAVQHGNYQAVADVTGLSYHWIQKFACGSIKNPTIGNVDKLEKYLRTLRKPNDHSVQNNMDRRHMNDRRSGRSSQ